MSAPPATENACPAAHDGTGSTPVAETPAPETPAAPVAETPPPPSTPAPVMEVVEEPKSEKMDWYILKVQSNREESIREGLLRRVAIAGLGQYFGDVIVPTEKVTEIQGREEEGHQAEAVLRPARRRALAKR